MAKEQIKLIFDDVIVYKGSDEQDVEVLERLGLDIPQEIKDRSTVEYKEVGQVIKATPNIGGAEYHRVQFTDGVTHKWKETEPFNLGTFVPSKFIKENKGKDSTKWSKE